MDIMIRPNIRKIGQQRGTRDGGRSRGGGADLGNT